MKQRLPPLARALIAAFLFASSLACGPFSQFLQNGGRGILTRMEAISGFAIRDYGVYGDQKAICA